MNKGTRDMNQKRHQQVRRSSTVDPGKVINFSSLGIVPLAETHSWTGWLDPSILSVLRYSGLVVLLFHNITSCQDEQKPSSFIVIHQSRLSWDDTS